MRRIRVPSYLHVAPTGIVVFGRPGMQPTILRQPNPLPALGVNPATDRQIILVLQHQLQRLGYPVVVAGRIDPETRAAIVAFAQAAHLSLDGPDNDRIMAIDQAYGTRFDHSNLFGNENPYIR